MPMSKRAFHLPRPLRVAAYWYVIVLWSVLALTLLLAHWLAGYMPGRVALRIAALDFDIYWYGVWIVGGIALGAFVVAELARARATAVFQQHVPLAVRQIPLTALDLPDEIRAILSKYKLHTLGDVLWQWGLEPRGLGLNAAGQAKLAQAIQPHLPPEAPWQQDPPWRVWNPDHVWNGLIVVLILAVIGARLYHILTPSPSLAAVGIASPLDYLRHPAKMLDFRSGGLGIYGGLAGGALGLWWYAWRRRIPMLAWADLAVIGLALGQVFGRWGNFFNQELYGRPTNLPWAITIDPLYRLPGYAEFSHFHPAFLYESLWSLLTFVVLYALWQRWRARLLPGDLMALYLIFYAVGRILLEMVRLDSRPVMLGSLTLNIAVATLISLLLAVAMLLWLGARHLGARHLGARHLRADGQDTGESEPV